MSGDHGCVLVTLHSGKLTSAKKAVQRLRDDIDLLAIDVWQPDSLRVPRWETSELLAGTPFERRADVSLKRNVGILLSKMAGWSRVLFLDDDITGRAGASISVAEISRAVDRLGAHNAVGLEVGGFPDNSVVCHAFRDAKGDQQTFVGAGALALAVGRTASFFPDVYNDDWFSLLNGDNRLQPIDIAGKVEQLPFDPFRTPARARSEELGEVLAEGIYWLLDQRRSVADADADHWSTYLEGRRQFIDSVLQMTRSYGFSTSERRRRVAALEGSLSQLRLITPALCGKYLEAWESDRRRWRDFIEGIGGRLHWTAAAAHLTRPGGRQLTWHVRPRVIGAPLAGLSPERTFHPVSVRG
jgi:hypothetical protein